MTKLYEVGGFVRDRFMGAVSKDVDYAVEAESFDAMRTYLSEHGFKIFLETPEYLTIRARFPYYAPGIEVIDGFYKEGDGPRRLPTADFVLCRKEGAYSDGRRPDEVQPGTIYDDLARRDFTMNAIAFDGASYIDPHGGIKDIQDRVLRAVGDPVARLQEDALRALRAIRFVITKGVSLDPDLNFVLDSDWLPGAIARVSVDRRREELARCFRFDTVLTINFLSNFSEDFQEAVFADGLWLRPTNEAL